MKNKIQKDIDNGMFYKICSNETTFKEYIFPLIDQAIEEERERILKKVQELNKYDYIPVQVKEENPPAWAMYTEGRNKIFNDLLSSLKIINNI